MHEICQKYEEPMLKARKEKPKLADVIQPKVECKYI